MSRGNLDLIDIMKRHNLSETSSSSPISRRDMLIRSAGLLAAGGAALTGISRASAANGPQSRPEGPAVRNGRIKQSIVQWPFEYFGENWTLEQTCEVAKSLGVDSIELLTADQFHIVAEHGLTCAIAQINMVPDPPFLRGFNNPDFWPEVMATTRETIEAAAEYGIPNVICFTGFSAKDPHDPNSPEWDLDEGARNCIEGLKQIIGFAEEKEINLCLENLNTRDDSHPMKGHPGYQGAETDYCIEIIKGVGSPRMKMLFDIYHAQIMDGDIIRRIHEHAEYIGHVHTAGNPGRHELDDTQELNYRPMMEALLEVGYTGYVGQEFLPTRDPYQGLYEAIRLCDV